MVNERENAYPLWAALCDLSFPGIPEGILAVLTRASVSSCAAVLERLGSTWKMAASRCELARRQVSAGGTQWTKAFQIYQDT